MRLKSPERSRNSLTIPVRNLPASKPQRPYGHGDTGMDVQWDALFRFEVAPLELFIRGSLMYWFIFVALRLAGRRDLGSLGMTSILLMVLIAEAASNGMVAQYESVGVGMVLVGTLFFWSVCNDRLAYFFRSPVHFFRPIAYAWCATVSCSAARCGASTSPNRSSCRNCACRASTPCRKCAGPTSRKTARSACFAIATRPPGNRDTRSALSADAPTTRQ